ncbi:MAG: Ger(x)C family spore germination protein [Defluviitaleaceae bacterium]|nr:Ger(x)C family spore germination protein [Defluviitaleaceae bacterium]
MQNTKFFSKFIVIGVLLLAIMSFNWDRIELEGRAFAITIGIDAAEGDEAFEVSMSIADVAAMEGQGNSDDAATLRIACGESLARAMGQIDAKISGKVYYGHTKAVVLGESVLADENLLREVVDTLSRKNDINIKCIVMATDASAKDILEAKPQEQSLLGLYLSGFYNNNNANTAASVVKLDLEGLVTSLQNDHSAVIPKITLDGEGEEAEVTISGVAIVRDFTLADYIPEDDMAGFLWLMENSAGAQIAIDEGDGHITFLVQKSKVRLGFEEAGGQLHCTARLHAEGSIEGARFMDDYFFDYQTMQKLQEEFAQKIRDEIEEVFGIFQHDFGVDGFGLKELMRKKYPRLYEVYGTDWRNTFENMVLVADVDVLIRNTGSIK